MSKREHNPKYAPEKQGLDEYLNQKSKQVEEMPDSWQGMDEFEYQDFMLDLIESEKEEDDIFEVESDYYDWAELSDCDWYRNTYKRKEKG